MGKKQAGENTKKVAGNAKKAEVASQKAATENAKKAAIEDEEWGKGSKSNSKKDAEVAKKADAARKKAEREALLNEEEKSAPAGPKGNKKVAVKKTGGRGLDLSQLDSEPTATPGALNATGIDNALDALEITSNNTQKIDRHPERRFPAALAAFTEKRLAEMERDGSGKGLRRDQRLERIRDEFKRHADNPFNQVTARYDTSKDEMQEIRELEKSKVEARLAGK